MKLYISVYWSNEGVTGNFSSIGDYEDGPINERFIEFLEEKIKKEEGYMECMVLGIIKLDP